MAQSQSPPPAVWSGKPRNVEDEPSCVTRKALQPAGTPVGAITKDRPNLSVRMLGSAALLLPLRSRFGLKVAVGGGAAPAGADAMIDMAPSSAVAAATAIDARTRFPMLPPSRDGPSRHEPRGRYPFSPLTNLRTGLSAWEGAWRRAPAPATHGSRGPARRGSTRRPRSSRTRRPRSTQ